ncbi:MAG: EscC/YscC/HrcC family type III secretion system outer membrane ring protein [Gammaproteobacteria bacterium]|nr:MAG: EscC/YscC/HrcC family type III secretion system outer membrane ring protein [Gammaproteobacteria bacterium]
MSRNRVFVLVLRARQLLVGTLLTLVMGVTVQAADIPGFDTEVRIEAREQPVGGFLSDLFGQLGIPVHIDPSISGSVNGQFEKPASSIFSDIAGSFHLRVYFDGAVAHVYPANQMVRTHLNMSKSQANLLVDSARDFGLTDEDNQLTTSDLGVMLTGTPRFVQQVNELADAVRKNKSAGSPPKRSAPVEDTYRVFPLRYAWADDVTLNIGSERVTVPGIASILRSIMEPGAIERPLEERVEAQGGSLDGLRGQGLQASSGIGSTASPGSSTRNTRIVADPVSNSVIVRDREDRMAAYESLIRELDVKPNMVEIEATIIDIDTDRLRELGVNWRGQGDDYEALLGTGNADDQNLVPASPPTVESNAGGVVSLVVGGGRDFIARIRALETEGAARIVSKPHVMTLANVEALMDTTSTFFVRVAGDEEVDLFDVTIGTTLRVTPHVHVDDSGEYQMKLRVSIEDGSQSAQQVDNIPVIERSTINTQAIVRRGQSLLIGGLVREYSSEGSSGLPGFKRLPIIGALFRNDSRSAGRVERMFLITPRLNTLDENAGFRYQAPVNEGSEADIVSSSAMRMDDLKQALGQRDSDDQADSALASDPGVADESERIDPSPEMPREQVPAEGFHHANLQPVEGWVPITPTVAADKRTLTSKKEKLVSDARTDEDMRDDVEDKQQPDPEGNPGGIVSTGWSIADESGWMVIN